MTRPTLLLVLSGVLLEVIVLGGLAMHVPGAGDIGSEHLADLFVVLLAVGGVCYLLVVALVLRRPMPRSALWFVLAVALAMRLTVLFAPPFLSSDVFRYVWDGKVQTAGVNPYRYLPVDPALAPLRDDEIYPNINRRDYAPTIYPPMAQLVFSAVAHVSPTVTAMKAAMVLFEMVAIAAILRMLAFAGLPRERVLIYAWNPLAVWTFAGNGHVDAINVGFVALALLARAARRPGLAGAMVAAAFLTKFLPVVIAPALWRRRDWRMPAAAAAVVVVLYLLYSSVGWRVLGFLPAYANEEGIEQGNGIWLLAGLARLFPLPQAAPAIYFLCVIAGFAALAARIALRTPTDDITRIAAGVAFLSVFAMIAISPHYPWYFVWLGVPACIAPLRSVIFLSVAPLLLYRNPLDERFLWPSLLFLPAILLAVSDYRRVERSA